MHTMPRADPRYNGFDVIRIFENNLTLADKRLVVAWFFSMIPIKEPKVDVLQLIIDLAAIIPFAGTAAKIFDISLQTAQVIKDISEIIGIVFEEEEVELARLKFELESAEEAFKKTREELLRCQIDLDNAREQGNALRSTIELLEDELRMLESGTTTLMVENFNQIITALESIRSSADNIDSLSGPTQGPAGWVRIDNSLINIRRRVVAILEVLNG